MTIYSPYLTAQEIDPGPVCIGPVGRPVGVRAAVAQGEGLVLHPDVDEVRNALVQDLFYSAGLAKPGFVAGSGAVEIAQARDTFADGRDCTDGLRAVGFWITRPPALSEVELLDGDPGLACRAADVAATGR